MLDWPFSLQPESEAHEAHEVAGSNVFCVCLFVGTFASSRYQGAKAT